MPRTCLVTGGSRGIGRAVAEALADEGTAVVVNYRERADAADEAVDAVEAAGGSGIAVEADVTDPAAVEAMVERTREAFGPVDVLVNNAGVADDAPLGDLAGADWRRVLAVALEGTVTVTDACFDDLAAAEDGRLVTVSSVAARRGAWGQASYAAANAGLEGFTRVAARELARHDATANCVAPGYVETDMTASLPDRRRARLREEIPLTRFAEPGEIADVVAFLASPAASYITGETLAIDGGLSG